MSRPGGKFVVVTEIGEPKVSEGLSVGYVVADGPVRQVRTL